MESLGGSQSHDYCFESSHLSCGQQNSRRGSLCSIYNGHRLFSQAPAHNNPQLPLTRVVQNVGIYHRQLAVPKGKPQLGGVADSLENPVASTS